MTDLTARYYNQLPQAQGGMMPQHTPGPWTVVPHDSSWGDYWIQQASEHIDTYLSQGRDDEATRIDAANARLVASAPDLLAVALLAQSLLSEEYSDAYEVLKQLDAAILKTGPSGLEG